MATCISSEEVTTGVASSSMSGHLTNDHGIGEVPGDIKESNSVSDAVDFVERPSGSDVGAPSDEKSEDRSKKTGSDESEKGDGGDEPDSAELVTAMKELYDAFSKYIKGGHPSTTISHDMIGMAYGRIARAERGLSLDSRISHGRIFSFMIQSYFRLVDDRLEALEKQTQEDQPRADDKKEPPPSEDDKTVDTTIPRVNRVSWNDFKRKEETQGSSIHAIDVLIGEAIIPHDVWRNRHARKYPRDLQDIRRSSFLQHLLDFPCDENEHKDVTAPVIPPSVAKGEYPPMPDRIRINGSSLQLLLEKALDISIFESNSPIVLLKPFKVLIQHEKGVRGIHAYLRGKFGKFPIPEESNASVLNQSPSRDHHSEPDVLFPAGEGKQVLEEYGSEQAYKELCCLVEFMDHDLQPLRAIANDSTERVFYSDLWHIFKPGEVVITSQEPLNAYRVVYVTAGRPYLSPPKDEDGDDDDKKLYKVPAKSSDLLVCCYQVEYDGSKFGPTTKVFTIKHYSGRQKVKDLPIYPLRLVEDSNVKDTLLSKGRKMLRLSKITYIQYKGPNLHEAEEIDSQVIVDFRAGLEADPGGDTKWSYVVDFGINPPSNTNKAEVTMISAGGCVQENCCQNDRVFNDIDIDHRRMENYITTNRLLATDTRYLDDDPDKVPEEDLILFPNEVFGFVLKDRKWALLDVNYVNFEEDTDRKRDQGWNSLILPDGHKQMVYSLVQSHFRHRSGAKSDRSAQYDLIRGKGKGLIILLHGAPGVGKTSTAECVAELCDLPLYPITCGDLGITASEVESRLKRIFMQAQKWKCVLLLDEADVFLSERGNNVKHNSLVSVFLRILEYYQGILFLTTNRVGKIDEAFRSRVHISLYYPPLDEDSTRKIFKENIKLAEKRGEDAIQVKKDEIKRFARDHYRENDPQRRWNGRQIRNAFHIAIAMAEDKALEKERKADRDGQPRTHIPVLKASYFKLVEAASTNFDDYLESVQGFSQQKLAHMNTNRQDSWNPDKHGKNKKHRAKQSQTVKSSESSTNESSDVESDKQAMTEDECSGHSEKTEDSVSSEEELTQREKKKRLERKSKSGKKEGNYGSVDSQKDSERGSKKSKEKRR